MILADTSIWVDHFRRPDPELSLLLEEGGIAVHPLVIEELVCGSLPRRAQTISFLRQLPLTMPVKHSEILAFVEGTGLHGLGLGAVDVHLLASARLTGFSLWTRDKALRAAAARLHLMA